MMEQRFGGNWTEEKLDKISKYLAAYTKIMSKQPFKFAYIDAFAGTGYREMKKKDNLQYFLTDLTESETQAFLEGSARIALKVEPSFQNFIFIEKDPEKMEILKRMVAEEFLEKKNQVKICCGDANDILQKICKKNWNSHRAVLFLDPFGMQVDWSTIEAVAGTKSIDMWLLFPLGACNRMLPKNGEIPPSWEIKLDTLFGDKDWKGAFYQRYSTRTLFETNKELIIKDANSQDIANYFVKRLQDVFSSVANHPRILYNSKNVPLFMLCFAAGNPRGAPTAVKIANSILGKI